MNEISCCLFKELIHVDGDGADLPEVITWEEEHERKGLLQWKGQGSEGVKRFQGLMTILTHKLVVCFCQASLLMLCPNLSIRDKEKLPCLFLRNVIRCN